MNKKTKLALIINISEDDLILVEAAQELNISLISTSHIDPSSERKRLEHFYSYLPFYNLPSAFDRKCSTFLHRLISTLEIIKIKLKHKTKLVIKNSKYYEVNFFALILSICIPYFRARINMMSTHWNKYLYLIKLSHNSIKVPYIQQIINDHDMPTISKINFPVICKPVYCSGGAGVKLAQNEEDIRQLFSNESNPQNFNAINLFYRNKNKLGLRNYIYNTGHFSGPYLIQDYIKGRVLSVSGVVVNQLVESLFCYEIIPTQNDYFAEQAFLWPIEIELDKKIHNLSQQMTQILNYPSGPFMIDFILSNDNQLYIIDAAPRASLTGAMLSRWAFQNNNHALNIISSHWNEIVTTQSSRKSGRAIFWQRFPFPKGKIKTITYPNFSEHFIIDHRLSVKDNDQVHEARLDRQMAERGYLVTTGNTLEEAKLNWTTIFNQINFEML